MILALCGAALAVAAHAYLQCPQCRRPLDGDAVSFGLLSCGTHTYPVIDGIPVLRHGPAAVQHHTTSAEEVSGPTVAELVELVRAGRGREALVRLLAFPPDLPIRGANKLFVIPGLSTLGVRMRQRTVRDMLGERRTGCVWPHAAGRLAINPIYGHQQGRDGGTMVEQFVLLGLPDRYLGTAGVSRW